MDNTDFRIDLVFPDGYEDFIAEIYYHDEFVCLISQEHGLNYAEIELDPAFLKGKLSAPLEGFLDAVRFASKRLHDLRKEVRSSGR